KWVYDYKEDKQGICGKFKARFVAKGSDKEKDSSTSKLFTRYTYYHPPADHRFKRALYNFIIAASDDEFFQDIKHVLRGHWEMTTRENKESQWILSIEIEQTANGAWMGQRLFTFK
ncbi:hypothetical protein HK101_008561, partial [Irineochytrium annulatum]